MPAEIAFDSGVLLASAAASSHAELQAAAGSEFGPLLVGLALLVVGAKLGGVLIGKWGQPSVLGELLFGIVLANVLPMFFGEVGLDFVRANDTLRFLAQIGVLLLLFDVGLEMDLHAFLRVGASAALVAIIGVIAPLGLGWAAARWFLPESPTTVHVFIGATLCATSVGITVRVLKDLGVTNRPEGQTIIGAAILDDVLGLIVLAVVAGSVSDASSGEASVSAISIAGIVLKAVAFLGITIVLGHFLSIRIVRLATRTAEHGVLLIIGVALCFTFAYIAELVGLADIIGAFAAGVFLDPYGQGIYTKEEEITLRELLSPLSDVLVPLFFVLMGLQVNLTGFTEPSVLALGLILIAPLFSVNWPVPAVLFAPVFVAYLSLSV
jgi:Kef-type K+ transport system membrane component KefB